MLSKRERPEKLRKLRTRKLGPETTKTGVKGTLAALPFWVANTGFLY